MGGTTLIGADIRERVGPIVDDLMERQHREVPELWVSEDPGLDDAVERSTRDSVDLMALMLERAVGAPSALPVGARLEASVVAQHGAEVDALVRTYRLGQQAMVEYFCDTVDRGRASLQDLRMATRVVHHYMDAVIPLVASEYADEHTRLTRWPQLRRLRAVQAALADEGAGADTVLDYALSGPHAAVVGASPETGDAVALAAADLEVDCLVVAAAGGGVWSWVATDRVRELADRLRAGGLDGPVGVGGPAGFAGAHRQALHAERVARRRGHLLIELREATLEVLALGDRLIARDVARLELAPLRGSGGRDLCSTLEAWFAAGESPGKTAALLEIAPRTVSHRLRRAERLLGHPIASRRAELEAALRLERLFADERSQAAR